MSIQNKALTIIAILLALGLPCAGISQSSISKNTDNTTQPAKPDQLVYSQARNVSYKDIAEIQTTLVNDSLDEVAWVNLIQWYNSQSREKEALEAWQKAFLHCKDTASFYLLRGDMETNSNRLEWYEKALQCRPDVAICNYKTGQYWLDSNPEKGLSLIHKALSLPTAEPWMYQDISNYYLASGQLDKIAGLAELMNKTIPATKESNNISGVLYYRANQFQKANEYFKDILSRDTLINTPNNQALNFYYITLKDNELPAYYESLLKCHSDDTTFIRKEWVSLNMNTQHYGRPDIETLIKVRTVFTKYLPDPDFKAAMLCNLVDMAKGKERSEQLTRIFENKLKQHPNDPDALYLLGYYNLINSREEKALTYLTRLNMTGQLNKDARVRLVSLLINKKDYTNAISLVEKACLESASPDEKRANNVWLAKTLIKAGRNDEADKIINITLSDKDNLKYLCYYYDETGQNDRAIACYRQYLESNSPVDKKIRCDFIELLQKTGKKEEAFKEAQLLINDTQLTVNDEHYKDIALDALYDYYQSQKDPDNLWSLYTTYDSSNYDYSFNGVLSNNLFYSFQQIGQLDYLLGKITPRLTDCSITFPDCVTLGKIWEYEKDTAHLVLLYEYMNRRCPGNKETLDKLIQLYQQASQPEKAIAAVESSMETQCAYLSSYSPILAKYYKAHGQNAKLAELESKLKKRAELEPVFYNTLAEFYLAQSNRKAAIESYEKYQECLINPLFQSWAINQNTIHLGELYSQESQYRKADKLYDNYLKNSVYGVNYYTNIVYTFRLRNLIMAGDFKKFMQLQEKNPARNITMETERSLYKDIYKELGRQGKYKEIVKLLNYNYACLSKQYPDITPWQRIERIMNYNEAMNWNIPERCMPMLEKQALGKSTNPLIYAYLQNTWNQSLKPKPNNLTCWKIAVKLFPNDPEPFEYLAEASGDANNPEESPILAEEKAISLYEARQNYYKVESLLVRLESLYRSNGLKDKAFSIISRYQEYLDKGKPYFNLTCLSSLYEKHQDYPRSIEAIQKLKDISKDKKDILNCQIMQARYYLKQGNYALAEKLLLPLMKDPDALNQDFYLYERLARAYDGQKKYTEELDVYLQFVQAHYDSIENKSSAEVLLDYCDNNTKTRIQGLAEACEKKLKADPENWVLQGIRAELYLRLGKINL